MSVRPRAALCILALAAATLIVTPATAQRRVGLTVAGGYAAGLDAPVLKDGGLGIHAGVWLERPSGIEFGLGGGWDRYEDRSLTTAGLFLNPANNSVGTANCTGCIAVTGEQEVRSTGRYLTPSIRVRARAGGVRPWASVGLGVYSIRNFSRTAFVPVGGGAPRLPFSNTTDDLAPGGNLIAGLGVPLGARVTIDAVAQLHGAIITGNDFFGGAGYASFGAGVTIR